MTSKKTLRIGVMMEEVQLSDIAAIDIFSNLSREIIAVTAPEQLESVSSMVLEIQWFFLGTTLEPVGTTPWGLKFVPTVTYDDCPRDLDVVFTGGPLLSHRPKEAEKFIKEAWPKVRVWMTTCIGALWIAHAGVMDGLEATANRMTLEVARKLHPNVKWKDQRWVIAEKPYEQTEEDKASGRKGELWTSGGASAGVDMVAEYAKRNFGEDFTINCALKPLDAALEGGNGQFYTWK